MTNEWITDRQPTKEDEDGDGEVLMQRFPDGRESSGGRIDACLAAAHVGPGVPWKHTPIWQPPATPAPEPEPTTRKVPRLFAAPPLRTWAPDGEDVLTALADDGTCWWSPGGEWRQIRPLPDREEPADA